MLSASLSEGDRISLRVWFGLIEMSVESRHGKLILSTQSGDVILPLSSLSHTSRDHSRYSKWRYLGKKKCIEEQYIDFEDQQEEDQLNLFDEFLKKRSNGHHG